MAPRAATLAVAAALIAGGGARPRASAASRWAGGGAPAPRWLRRHQPEAAPRWLRPRGGSSATKKKNKAKRKKVVEEEEELEEEAAVGEIEAPVELPPLRDDFPTAHCAAAVDASLDASTVRISADVLAELDLGEGDLVRVHGARRGVTTARVELLEDGEGIVVSQAVASNSHLGATAILRGVELREAAACELVPERSSLPEALQEALGTDDAAANDEIFEGCVAPFFQGNDRPVSAGDVFEAPLTWEGEDYDVQWKVASVTIPGSYSTSGSGVVAPDSDVAVGAPYDAEAPEKVPTYADLGGCGGLIEQLREVLELPLHSPELFRSLGVDPPKGALIHGPPGTGKTTLLRAAAAEAGVHVEFLNGGDVAAKKSGEGEELLRAKFAAAERQAPAIVAIDELEAIAVKRDKADSEQDKRVCAQLLTLMDGLRANSGVVVLAATGSPNELDPAMRRFGRLDREVALEVPDEVQRAEILEVKCKDLALAPDVDLTEIAKDCHGFVGADMAQLCTEAALLCVKGAVDAAGGIDRDEDDLDEATIERAWDALEAELEAEPGKLQVTKAHFTLAAKTCNPSSLRESVVEVPDISWADVGGLEDVKRELKETVEYPVQYAEEFVKFGMPPSKGVLFYGPPGCGKTLIAKAVANECGANFISVKGPELLTMWFGESEANVRGLFDKARAAAPCILFFDEMDSIAKARAGSSGGSEAGDRVMNQILAEIDAVGQKNVFVIGATNRPDILDPAVTRPGRLDQLIHIPLPDRDSRRSIFAAALRKAPLAPGVDLDKLADFCQGFSGADISEICQRAAKNAVKDAVARENAGEDLEGVALQITTAHVEEAVSRARKSIPQSEIDRYNAFDQSMKTSAKAGAETTFSFAKRGWVSAEEAAAPAAEVVEEPAEAGTEAAAAEE